MRKPKATKLDKDLTAQSALDAYRDLYGQLEEPSEWADAAEFAVYAERQGGWWADDPGRRPDTKEPDGASLDWEEPRFEGSPDGYPLHFQPYMSLQFGGGSGASLPWLQQLPDPASSAMWGLPVEVDPGTAARLQLSNGDLVRLHTPAGSLEAPVYVNPAAIPGVIGMAAGQGHTGSGRYASGRGANPFSVVVPARESSTGVPAFGGTRCRLEKLGRKGSLAQFSTVDREHHLVRL